MPQLVTPGIEDTEPVDLSRHVPTPWYQRSPAAVVAGGLGIFLLAAIIFAVITVSNDSTRPAGVVRSPATSLTPLPSVVTTDTTSSTPTEAATPSPTDSPQPVPPTVTETVSTENATTEAPPPGWPGGGRWRHLFPHLFFGGQ
jgi:hypothetical protein